MWYQWAVMPKVLLLVHMLPVCVVSWVAGGGCAHVAVLYVSAVSIGWRKCCGLADDVVCSAVDVYQCCGHELA